MKNNEEKFCEAYNAFWGNSLTSPQQLKCHAMDGHELQEFCEFYFKENLTESALRHFYVRTNKANIWLGIMIGILVTFLLVITLYFFYENTSNFI